MDANENSQTAFQDALGRFRADLASPRRAELVRDLLNELTAEVSPRRQRRDPISRLLDETLDALSRAYRDGTRAPRNPLLAALILAGGVRFGRARASASSVAANLVSQTAVLAANVAALAVLVVGMSLPPSIGATFEVAGESHAAFMVGGAPSANLGTTTASLRTFRSDEIELLAEVDAGSPIRTRASIEFERSIWLGVRRSVEVEAAGNRTGVEGVTLKVDCDPRSRVKSAVCDSYDRAAALGVAE